MNTNVLVLKPLERQHSKCFLDFKTGSRSREKKINSQCNKMNCIIKNHSPDELNGI